MHWLWLHGPQGEVVRANALFNGGAMVGAMCLSLFEKVKHRLHGQTKPSNWLLRCERNNRPIASGLERRVRIEWNSRGRGV